MRFERPLRAAAAAVAAVSVASAGAIHFRFGPSHLEESLAYGVFFYGVGALQLMAALAVAVALARERPVSGRLRWTVIALNLGVTAVWALTRVAGPPVGPRAGVAEPVEYGDLAAVAFQLLSALSLLVTSHERAMALDLRGHRVPAAIATVMSLLLAVPLVVAASPKDHEEPSGGDGHEEPSRDHGHEDSAGDRS